MHVCILNGQFQEGLSTLAKVILETDEPTSNLANEFISWVGTTNFPGISVQKCLLESNQLITSAPVIVHTSKGRVSNRGISSAFEKHLTTQAEKKLFQNIQTLCGAFRFLPECHDAILKIMIDTMGLGGLKKHIPSLVRRLYETAFETTPQLKLSYAHFCLEPVAQYDQAIILYESVLDSNLNMYNPFQTRRNYTELAALYYVSSGCVLKKADDESTPQNTPQSIAKMQKAGFLLDQALFAQNSPNLRLNLDRAFVHVFLGEYEEGFSYFERLLKLPKDVLTKENIQYGHLKKDYTLMLQLTGKEAELAQRLCEKQKMILQKNTRIAALIKQAQAQYALEQQRLEERHQVQQRVLSQSRTQQHSRLDSTDTTHWEDDGAPSSSKGHSQKQTYFFVYGKLNPQQNNHRNVLQTL